MNPNSQASLRGRVGAYTKWANTTDRSEATRAARAAFEQKFLDAADGDAVRAEALRKAHYARLALKSAAARRTSRARARADQAARELDAIAKAGGAA